MTSQIITVLADHTQDVRAVSAYPGGGILTGSRDSTAKMYAPTDPKNPHSEFAEQRTFTGTKEFVSSVCYGKTKSGTVEIYAGCHDNNIYVYTVEDSKPIATLMKHTGPVSALAFRQCNDQDTLVSGGWDGVTVLWRDRIPEATLYGHVHGIWAVAFVARSFVLTGGADKTIRKWNLTEGNLMNVFEGHTDCVRGLAVINGSQFLSCSNDTTVILWSMMGDILQTFEGHTNYVYSICIVREPIKPDQEPPKTRPYTFVTVSEDKTVRIWSKDQGCMQTIPLQATTLWSVAALDSGNFAVGTSDGHTYVFTGPFGASQVKKPEDVSEPEKIQETN